MGRALTARRMVLHQPESFLHEVRELMARSKEKNSGTCYITMKKLLLKDHDKENSCLVRAKLGNDKISTVLVTKDHEIMRKLMEVMRENMSAMKKPVREKDKKKGGKEGKRD